MQNKIAIFGGTFDPIHNGHIEIAKIVSREIGFSKIIFIPTFVSPHKIGKVVSSPDIRLKMVNLAVKKLNSLNLATKFEVSDYEILKKVNSYTIDTIKHFKSRLKIKKLYLIIGEDSKNSFNRWKDYELILKEVKVISISRETDNENKNNEMKDKFFLNKFTNIKIKNIEISSSDIRDRVKNKKSISNMVQREVEDIIIQEKLYLA